MAGRWLRLLFVMFFVAYVVAIYWLSRRYVSPGVAFLVALVSVLHVNTIWLSDVFFAEIPFALTSLTFFLVVMSREGKSAREWLGGLLGVVAFLLRSSGIALLAAWVGESLLQKRFRVTLLRFILALIPVAIWLGYIAHVKSSVEYAHPAYLYQRAPYQYYNVGYVENLMYVDPFIPELGRLTPNLMLQRIVRNLQYMPVRWGEAISSRAEGDRLQLERINREFSPFPVPLWLVDVVLGCLGMIILVGLVLLVRRRERLIPLYVAGSVALICLTPWPGQFGRYLVPLTPLFALAFFIALGQTREWMVQAGGRFGTPLAVVFIAAMAIAVFGQETFVLYKVYTRKHSPAYYLDGGGRQRHYDLFFYSEAWQQHDRALAWLKAKAESDAVVATSTPHRVYLQTGLRAVMPPFEPDARKAQRLLDSVPVAYVVVDSLDFVDTSRRYAEPVVHAYPDRWQLVYSTGPKGSRVYARVKRDESTISRR